MDAQRDVAPPPLPQKIDGSLAFGPGVAQFTYIITVPIVLSHILAASRVPNHQASLRLLAIK